MGNFEERLRVRQEQHEREKLIVEVLELQKIILEELDSDDLKIVIEEFKQKDLATDTEFEIKPR